MNDRIEERAMDKNHKANRLLTATLLLVAIAIPALITGLLYRYVNQSTLGTTGSSDAELIQGNWTVVELHQVAHTPSEVEKAALKAGFWKIAITKDKMIHSVDKSAWRYRLDPTKKPKQLILIEPGPFGLDGEAVALYKLYGDDLKIWIGRADNPTDQKTAPADFDVKRAKPGTFPTVFVLKRDRDNGKPKLKRLGDDLPRPADHDTSPSK